MGDTPRILVVDDELGVRESLRLILRPHYEVETAASGEEALKALRVFRPDLVFLDIKLPTLDGLEVLRRLKAWDPRIEVVMVTAYASFETLRKSLANGAFEYLTKPFSRQEVEETTRRALARRTAHSGEAGQTEAPAQVRIALVGGGKGGRALLDLLLEWPAAKVSVVVDPRPEAPALGKAQALGIPTARWHGDVFAYPVDLVLEVTGQQSVLDDLLRTKPPGVEVIGAGSLRFFWDLLKGKVTAARQLRAQLDMAVALESTLDLNEQLLILTRTLALACGVDRCSVFLWNEATGLVTPVISQFATGEANERLWEAFKGLGGLKLTEVPFFYELMERGRPTEIDEPGASPLIPSGWADLFDLKSVLVVPMFRKDQVVGACVLDYCRDAHRFTSEQIVLASALASQVGLALENAQLYQDVADKARRLSSLLEATKRTAAIKDSRQLLPWIVQEAAASLSAEGAGIRIREGEELVYAAHYGYSREGMRDRMALGESGTGWAVRHNRPLTILDLEGDPRMVRDHQAAYRREGFRSMLAVPMRIGAQVIGALFVLTKTPRHFSATDIEVLASFADQAALAVDNLRLYEAAEQRRAEAQRLAELGRRLSQSLDPEEVAQRVVDSVRVLLGVQRSALFRLNPDSGDLVALAVAGDFQLSGGSTRVLPHGTGVAALAVRERCSVTTPDFLADPRVELTAEARARLEQEAFRATLAVPLIAPDTVIGALAVQDATGRAFEDATVRLVEAFATQAVLALQNAWLYDEAQRERREAKEQARLAQALTSTLKLSDVLDSVARAATDFLADSAGRIWVVEDDRLVLRAEAGTHGPPGAGRKAEFAFGEGQTGHAAATRELLVVEDVLADPRTINVEWMRQEGYVSLVGVPLVVQDSVVGVLTLLTRHRHRFSQQEIERLTSFGAYAAVAIQNARLYTETDRRRREAEVLAGLGRTINASLELDTILQRVAEGAKELCRSDVAMIALRDPGSETVAVRYRVGARYERWDTVCVEPGKGVGGQVLLSGRPFRTTHYTEDSRISKEYVEVIRQEGIVAELAVPVQIEARVQGVLYAANRTSRPFSDRDEAILLGLADQAAIAIQNAHLFEETQRRRRTAESLAEVGRLLSQSLDLNEVGQRIVDGVRALLGALSAFLFRVEPKSEDWTPVALSGDVGPGFVRGVVYPRETGATGLALRERCPVVTPDVLNDPRIAFTPEVRAHVEQAPYRAVLAVPLLIQDRAIGVLAIGDRAGRVFTDEEMHLARTFADQAATALENARLFQQTQQAYEELQRTQDQLTQVQKMEAIGRLAGGIAHDFNNLLTVMTGRAHLVLTRLPAEDPSRRDVELIQRTAARAAEFVRQILAFSRKQALEPKVLDLNQMIANLESTLQRLIGEDITLVTITAPEAGCVKADLGQLEQVILNLVVNAGDAMPQGGRLTLETANVDLDAAYARRHVEVRPGPYVMLAVSDTGIGMTPEILARAFEPFFTTKGPGTSTGLGLSTVYGIVKQSGGHIGVYSEPGKGTTFKIYLSRIDGAGAKLEPGPALPRASKGSETVLLVEDEGEVRELARDILQAHGYTVLAAPHGAEALRICEQYMGPIDLLLTDIVMPQMSGRQLAERLAPLRSEMRVLYMSGYTDNAVVHHGVLDPGTAYLQKPFTPEGLAHKVREVLDATRKAPR